MILGIGIDLVEIERIRRVGTERLARRILTEEELRELSARSHRRVEMLAGRFAAKEAISKALGCGIGKVFSFYDAQITYDIQGKPQAMIATKVLDQLYPNKNISVHISITHTRELASAFGVIEELPMLPA